MVHSHYYIAGKRLLGNIATYTVVFYYLWATFLFLLHILLFVVHNLDQYHALH